MSFFEKIPTAQADRAFELNDDQSHALDALRAFLDDKKAKYFGLFGAAGTGKTSVIGRLIGERMEYSALCGPTHKSTGVLSEKAPIGTDCHTIHRLLGCKKTYDKEKGEVEFLPNESKEIIGQYDVVVVDECSMIGDRMYRWITDARARYDYGKKVGTKIIFLGDPYQLPPVNDGDKSPTFGVSRSVELTEIMRHKGVIQRSCDAVREAMIDDRRPPLAKEQEDDHGQILQHRNSEQGVDEFFDRFLEAPESSKALAFKNSDVDFMNGFLRRRLYGEKADSVPFIPGERLVVQTTYESPTSGGVYYTGTECTLEAAERDRREGLDCWRLYLVTDYGAGFEAFAFGDKDQRRAFMEKIKDLKARAKSGSGSWRGYFAVKETFARVRPGYATTIHKSQGSTYDRVFLLQSELVGLWDQELLARLLYVAYSRAKEEIVLL